MLSPKLIELIEAHAEKISNRILRQIRRDPSLAHLANVPEAELRERAHQIVQNLGDWLEFGDDQTLAWEYQNVGKRRFEESVPLHESIRGLCLIKYAMIDFIHEQGTEADYMVLYAEEELERRVARFFDMLVVHMARGYEVEWRHTMHATA